MLDQAKSDGLLALGNAQRGEPSEPGFRYALYRSYVLLGSPLIEPISEHIPDQIHSGMRSA